MRTLLVLLVLVSPLPLQAATYALIDRSVLTSLIPPQSLQRHLGHLVAVPQRSYSRADHENFARIYATLLTTWQQTGRLDTDPRQQQRVVRLYQHLVAAAATINIHTQRWAWEAHVVSDPSPYAHAYAGGKMWLSTGLLASLRLSDDELAAVLAHEMAHVLINTPPAQDLAARHGQEIEADVLGMVLMIRAGFRPQAAIALLQRTSASEDSLPPDARLNHPPKQYRAALLQALLPDIISLYDQGGMTPR